MNENHTYNRIALYVWFCFCPFFVTCVSVTCFLLFQSAIMANNPPSSRTAGVPTRSTANTWVIGASAKDVPPNRLPTLRQVLAVFFYEHKVCNRRERGERGYNVGPCPGPMGSGKRANSGQP